MDIMQTVAHMAAPSRPHSSAKYLQHILTWGLRVVVFLIPLIVVPSTFEILEFNKQLFLIGAGVLLLTVWVSHAVVAREAIVVKNPLNWSVLGVLAAVVAATVFSTDPITSVLGFYGRFNGSLVSLLSYIILYFLATQELRSENGLRWLGGSWLGGVGLGAFIFVLQMLGARLFSFPAAQAASFTTLTGSLNAMVLLLAASLPMAFLYIRWGKSILSRWLAVIFTLVALLSIFFVDYQLGWLGLIIGSAVWLGLIFWHNEAVGYEWTIIPALSLLVAVLAWPIATQGITGLRVPSEVNLSAKASWQVAWQNVSERPILGTGPETFIYGFSKFKPDGINDSDFWAYRFDKASSELAQVFATTGYLGLLALTALLLFGLYQCYNMLKYKETHEWYVRMAVAVSFLIFALAHVFYFMNTVLSVGFWLTLAMVTALSSRRERTLSLVTSPRTSFGFSFGLALILLTAIGTWFMGIRFVMADTAYTRAQKDSRASDTLDTANQEFVRAINLNPFRDTYRIGLAQAQLALASRVAQEPPATAPADREAQLERLKNHVTSSIATARSATGLSPRNVANWEALGSIYRGSVLFARDAETWVIDSYQKAIEKEGKNPALYTELGKAYLLSANRRKQSITKDTTAEAKAKIEQEVADLVAKAQAQLAEAIKIKGNYTPAHFNEALAFEQLGKLAEAVAKLERMRATNPQDIDVLYELGSLYFGQADYGKAESVFTTITSLVPNHANSHYGLALTYIKQGNKDKAITQLQKVLELNPGNKDIQKLIDDLKKPAVEQPKEPAPAKPAPKKK